MWARRIIRLTVLLLLLIWAPGSAPDPVHPIHSTPSAGGCLDVGLRLDPGSPWSSWRVYLEVYAESGEPDVQVEVGAGDFARAAGGLVYVVLTEGIIRISGGRGGSR